jgi:hypothetical protein
VNVHALLSKLSHFGSKKVKEICYSTTSANTAQTEFRKKLASCVIIKFHVLRNQCIYIVPLIDNSWYIKWFQHVLLFYEQVPHICSC